MYCISCHTLSDLLFYHIDHLDFGDDIFIFRHYELSSSDVYLFFNRVSDGASVCFLASSDDRILYELHEVNYEKAG